MGDQRLVLGAVGLGGRRLGDGQGGFLFRSGRFLFRSDSPCLSLVGPQLGRRQRPFQRCDVVRNGAAMTSMARIES